MPWLLAFLTLAQSQFDVVSVKPSAPDEHNSFMFRPQPGGLRAAGIPLKMLIMESYDLKAFQVSGGPSWVASERWDVLAKADGVEGQIPMARMRPMLQAMIADRFKLKIHKETKEMPVYALVMEKNGLKIVPHAGAEQQFRFGDGSLIVKKGGTAALATWLSRQLGRVVIDQTNLKDEYDYTLQWTPDPGQGGAESIGLPPELPRPHADTNGPSIFTALQEQLGLRLVSQKGPVEIIVIDSVEKPSAN
jgi:bla regulator protein blaR1